MYNQKYHDFRNIIDWMKDNEYWLKVPDHSIKTSYEFWVIYDRLCELQKSISYAKIQKMRYDAINYFIKNQWKSL